MVTYQLDALVAQEDGMVGLRKRVSGGVADEEYKLHTGMATGKEGRSVCMLFVLSYATSASLRGQWHVGKQCPHQPAM